MSKFAAAESKSATTIVAACPELHPDESLSPNPILQNVKAVSGATVESERSPAVPSNLTLVTALLISEEVVNIKSSSFVLIICPVPSKASYVLPSVVPCTKEVLKLEK